MHAEVVWWDLAGSGQTIESLRDYLRDESIPAFSQVAGLRLKIWISDPATSRWGAILLWDSEEAARQPLPSRATALIGSPAVVRCGFDVEATIEGQYQVEQLVGRGLAFGAEVSSGG
jgi:hypothetical protein